MRKLHYMTGIQSTTACKDPIADALIGKFGNRGEGQPRVGQREAKEAMQKVQEGRAPSRTQSSLPQHQARFGGRTHTAFETSAIANTSTVTSISSVVTVSDRRQSFNDINNVPRNMVSSTPRTAPANAVEDGDEDAEYKVEDLERCRQTSNPVRPPGPMQRRGFGKPPT